MRSDKGAVPLADVCSLQRLERWPAEAIDWRCFAADPTLAQDLNAFDQDTCNSNCCDDTACDMFQWTDQDENFQPGALVSVTPGHASGAAACHTRPCHCGCRTRPCQFGWCLPHGATPAWLV